MESFVVDENNKFISGDKAFELIDKKNQYQAMTEIFKDQAYAEILMNKTAANNRMHSNAYQRWRFGKHYFEIFKLYYELLDALHGTHR